MRDSGGGGACVTGGLHARETATEADATHPTGMLSFCSMYLRCTGNRTCSTAHLPPSSGTRLHHKSLGSLQNIRPVSECF